MYDSVNRIVATERLLLRLFQSSDVEDITRLCNNYNVSKSTLFIPYPYIPDYAIAWIATLEEEFVNEKSYNFAITDKTTKELYGGIGLSHNAGDKNGETGFWLGEPFWGKGIAAEAAKAIIDFAFSEKKFHKVYARHFESNPPSGKVLQKCGMSREGMLLEHILKENKYENVVHYGIINAGWRQRCRGRL